MDCSTPGLPVHHQLPEFTQTHVHRVGDAIQPSHPLSSPSPPASIFPSITGLSNEPVLLIRWPNDWSFSFSTSPSDEYSGLISFRMNWLDPLAVQGTLKSLLQHHSSKASILWHSAFLILQLSHLYMTTGKIIALTRWTLLFLICCLAWSWGFPGGSDSKESSCNAGDPGSIPGLGRSPGEGNGNPLQCSCLEKPRDKGAGGLPSMGSHRVGYD